MAKYYKTIRSNIPTVHWVLCIAVLYTVYKKITIFFVILVCDLFLQTRAWLIDSYPVFLQKENLSQFKFSNYTISVQIFEVHNFCGLALFSGRISIIVSHSVFLQSVGPIVIIAIFKDDKPVVRYVWVNMSVR